MPAWAVLGLFIVAPVKAGPIPLQEAITYDGPQPHGPGGTVLVEHGPHNSGGLASDTLFSETNGGTPFPSQIVADNFVLAQTALVHRIQFWGFYNESVEPIGNESFQIQIYDDNPTNNIPAGLYYETTFVNVPRVWTGRQVIAFGGGREYLFTVDLPQGLLVDGGATRWLSVHQVGDLSSAFRWEFGINGPFDGQAIQNPTYPNWVNTNDFNFGVNTAFRLISIPEPGSISFLCVGVWMVLRRSRRFSF